MKNGLWTKVYVAMTAGIISLVGVLHLLRIIFQVPVVVGAASIPMFLSYLGLAGSAGIMVLAYFLLRK